MLAIILLSLMFINIKPYWNDCWIGLIIVGSHNEMLFWKKKKKGYTILLESSLSTD